MTLVALAFYAGVINMIMSDIIQRFRDENPEIDQNVIPDGTLQSWLLVGDQEVCMDQRLITIENVQIPAITNENTYLLTSTNPLFFDINESYGGGLVYYNTSGSYKRIYPKTKAWLDNNNSQWRTASAGTPRYYYRSGSNIVVYPTPDSTILYFNVDLVLLSNPFNNLNIMPYNQIPYLAPFHYALCLYLQWRAKIKVGKDEDGITAYKLYQQYLQWMRKTIQGGRQGEIEFRPQGLPSIGYQR